MKIRLLIYLPVLLFCNTLLSQGQDYKVLCKADSSIFVCHVQDSNDVAALIAKLEAFVPDSFTSNRQFYHYDLGMAYYKMSIFSNDSHFMRKACNEMKNALKVDPYYVEALWNTALMSANLNDCSAGLYYLDLYLRLKKNKSIDKDSIKFLRRKCGN